MTLKTLAPEEAKANWEREWEGLRKTKFQQAIYNNDLDDATGILTETIEAVLGEENTGRKRSDNRAPVMRAAPNTRGDRYQTIHKLQLQRFLRQPQELRRAPTEELRAAASRRRTMLARRTIDIGDIELGTEEAEHKVRDIGQHETQKRIDEWKTRITNDGAAKRRWVMQETHMHWGSGEGDPHPQLLAERSRAELAVGWRHRSGASRSRQRRSPR